MRIQRKDKRILGILWGTFLLPYVSSKTYEERDGKMTIKESIHELNAQYFEYLIDTVCLHHDDTPYTDSEIGKYTRLILQEYIKDVQKIAKKEEN